MRVLRLRGFATPLRMTSIWRCVSIFSNLAFALDDGRSGFAAGSFGGDLAHLLAERGAVHDELLCDAEEVADRPVEPQARGVVPYEVAGDGGHHEGHHLLLLRVDSRRWRVVLHQEL